MIKTLKVFICLSILGCLTFGQDKPPPPCDFPNIPYFFGADSKCLGPNDAAKCDKYLTADSKGNQVCLPYCPTGFTEGTDAKLNVKTCKSSNTSFDWTLNPIFKCGNGIKDLTALKCYDLSTPYKCTDYFLKDGRFCVKACPDNHTSVDDYIFALKVCVMNYKAKFDVTLCGIENVSTFASDDKCLKQSEKSNCRQVLAFDSVGSAQCLPACPVEATNKGFSVSNDSNGNKVCNSNNSFKWLDQPDFIFCKKVRDLNQLTCVNEPSACSASSYFIREFNVCASVCPPGFMEGKDANAKRKYCVPPPDYQPPSQKYYIFPSCPTGTFFNFFKNSCISNQADCDQYYMTDADGNKLCWPTCPTGFVANQKLCSTPANKKIPDLMTAFWGCSSGRNINDFSCIGSQSDCSTYYMNVFFMCVPQCPQGFQQNQDPNKKECYFQSNNNNNNNNNNQGACALSQFPGDKCLSSPSLCQWYLFRDAFKFQICMIECPSQFTKGFDQQLQVNTCTPPATLDLQKSAFAQCETGLRDLIGFTCLAKKSDCKGFFDQNYKACMSSCPSPNTITTDSDQIKVCNPPLSCQSPQVIDKVNTKCLDKVSSCQTVYFPDQNACIAACPTGFFGKVDSDLGAKVCIPCMFKDDSQNCLDRCPSPKVGNIPTGLCLDDSSKCTNYFIKAQNICDKQCPFGFSPDDTTSPKSCKPCDQSGTCANQSTNDCKYRLSSDLKSCAIDCPPGEFTLPKPTDSQPFEQCKKCPTEAPFVSLDNKSCVNQCGTGYIVLKERQRCIDANLCDKFFQDDKGIRFCVKSCPIGFQEVKDANTGIISCQSCLGGFFDLKLNKCVDSCTYYDSSKVFCLVDITDCNGIISADGKSCLKQCPINSKFRVYPNSDKQQCVDGDCKQTEYLLEQEGKNICTSQCPPKLFGDDTSKKCIDVSKCPDILTFDRMSCVKKCQQGFYPAIDGTIKICKPCTQRLSSDGLSCGSSCSSSELFDLDLKQCVAPDSCSSKIIQPDGKSCSKQCLPGQIQSLDANQKPTCLAKITDCPNKISSDFKSCGSSCQSGEAEVLNNSKTICTYCQFGATSDKKNCNTSCQSDQVFNVSTKTCITSAACNTNGNFVSSDGKQCVSSCVFPDMKRAGNTSNCFTSCNTDQVYIKGSGCVASNTCSKYLSSDKKTCVDSCNLVFQVVDNAQSSPKTCKKCDEGSYFKQIGSDSFICQQQSDDNVENSKSFCKGLDYAISQKTTIAQEFKKDVKNQVLDATSQLESSFKQVLSNNSLSKDQQTTNLIDIFKNLVSIAKSYISKIEVSQNDDPNDKLNIGSEKFQVVSERKKPGKIFSINFSSKDFGGAQTPNLQKDASTLDPTVASTTTDSSIDSLSATTLQNNPFCKDAGKCGQYILFQVDVTYAQTRRRILDNVQTSAFQMSFSNIPSSQIDKTTCVTYDSTNSSMTQALSTTTDKTNSSITCQFTGNVSLYYDSSCSFISQTACAQPSQPASPSVSVTPTNSLLLSVPIFIISLLSLLI